jgi:hypothetical protein
MKPEPNPAAAETARTTDIPAVVHERLVRRSLPVSMKDLLHYEICAAWWPQFISWGPLQDLIAAHFSRKIERKYRRWKWCVERSERLANLIPPNEKRLAHADENLTDHSK